MTNGQTPQLRIQQQVNSLDDFLCFISPAQLLSNDPCRMHNAQSMRTNWVSLLSNSNSLR